MMTGLEAILLVGSATILTLFGIAYFIRV